MNEFAAQRLRALVEEGVLVVPGAPNALMGRLIERAGFGAVYLSGAGVSAGVLALPDVGLITLTELCQQTRYLSHAVDLPVIVDADTGFGNAVNVERTVQELSAAGAAAIQLEDQQMPKRCGHLSGKTLVSLEEMCAKLRAADAARDSSELVIIARTDARGVNGFADAIARARAYVQAGADWIFPEALSSREEFSQFAAAVEVPLVANMTEFGRSPLLTVEQLEELGYRVVLFPLTLQRVAMRACEAALALLAADGTQRELLDLMQDREELYDLLDYQDFEERDREYFRLKEE